MVEKKIEIKTIDEAISKVKSPVIVKIYIRFKEYFPKELIFTGNYVSKKEILESIEERMIESIQEDYLEVKSQITGIRKTGQDIKLVDLEVLSVPLKVNILKIEFSLKNLNKIFSILDSVKTKLKTFTPPKD